MIGMLIDGVWQERGYEAHKNAGRFVRAESAFRAEISPQPGSGFPAQPGRYHLYVSLACPWAQRTLIVRKLKHLEPIISVSVVHPHMGEQGWRFASYPGATPDHINGFEYLHQVYTRAKPDYTGRVTVPVLWDTQRATIVNNESAEIIRMLNHAFDEWGNRSLDLYPPALRTDIDAINAYVYDRVNNGVYKAGFAVAQTVYEEEVGRLFEALDHLERRLAEQRYLVGNRITEADWRLFTTLARFDAAYVGHFKCNIRRLVDYPRLWAYARELYQTPGVAETMSLDHIKRHYYTSHPDINPSAIIPVGPQLNFDAPHGRG